MTGVTGAEVVAVALADFDDDVAVELIPDSVLTIFLLLSLMMPQLSLQHDGLSSHTFTRGKNPVPVEYRQISEHLSVQGHFEHDGTIRAPVELLHSRFDKHPLPSPPQQTKLPWHCVFDYASPAKS